MSSDLNSALALFRSLFKSKQGDVYTIIERFILVGVKSKGLLAFTNDEIVDMLKDTFNIEIPVAIIQKCINSHQEVFKYSRGKYVVIKPDDDEVDSIIMEMNRIEEYKSTIINELVEFIEKGKNVSITVDDKKQLSQTFFDFIADRDQVQENDYRLLITQFIIKKDKDVKFQEFINSMKEGMVIYKGIRYSDSPNDTSWDNDTDFFLDVEYLFSAFGLNGSFFEKCFMEFYSLVQEINSASNMRGGRKRIRLYYFPGTKVDIDSYFAQAARIRRGEERYLYTQDAMDKILSECKDDLSVGNYKAKLFVKLKSLGIEEYRDEIDLNKHSDYLFESSEFEIAKERRFAVDQISEVDEYIQIADYINILRQGKRFYSLEKCKCMFLSEGKLSNDLSRFIKEYYNETKPVVITRMSTFTEQMWFKLRKGVVSNDSNMTFSVVNKAKTIISGLVHDHLKKQYEEVLKLEEDDEVKKACYADLRTKRYSPDDINSDTIEDNMAFIDTINYLEEYNKSQERLKAQAAKTESLEKQLAEEKEKNRQMLEKLENNAAQTKRLKLQIEKEHDEKQAMNDRIVMLENNMAKENEQKQKFAIEQARKRVRVSRFFYRYWWLWIILAIVVLFVIPPILWMEHEVGTIYAVGGALISLVAFIAAMKIKTRIRKRYIRRYRKILVMEMNNKGVK